jgi:hypothetical protein
MECPLLQNENFKVKCKGHNFYRTGKCLRQVEHIRGHLWHRYSISVNQVVVATVKLSKWWPMSTSPNVLHTRHNTMWINLNQFQFWLKIVVFPFKCRPYILSMYTKKRCRRSDFKAEMCSWFIQRRGDTIAYHFFPHIYSFIHLVYFNKRFFLIRILW